MYTKIKAWLTYSKDKTRHIIFNDCHLNTYFMLLFHIKKKDKMTIFHSLKRPITVFPGKHVLGV